MTKQIAEPRRNLRSLASLLTWRDASQSWGWDQAPEFKDICLCTFLLILSPSSLAAALIAKQIAFTFWIGWCNLRNGSEEAWSRVSFLQFLPCHGNRLLPWANCSDRCLQKRTEVSQCLLLSDHAPNEDHFPELLVKLAFAYWLASEITAWGRRRRRESVEVFFFSQDLFSV